MRIEASGYPGEKHSRKKEEVERSRSPRKCGMFEEHERPGEEPIEVLAGQP